MIVEKLGIKNFRNLEVAFFEPSNALNFIVGGNGSGKSALLESVYLLGRGKSYRTNQTRHMVQHGKGEFSLKASISHGKLYSVHLEGSGKNLTVKVNDERLRSRSELMNRLHVCLLSDASGTLVDGVPGVRRNFLNWIMFHVEPENRSKQLEWNRVRLSISRLLKSRNLEERRYWYSQFADMSESISRSVIMSAKKIEHYFRAYRDIFPQIDDVSFEYLRGWPSDASLEKLLLKQDEQASRKGYLLSGPQRSDLRFLKEERNVADYLSNGQKRLFSVLLVLSAVQFIGHETGVKFVLLLDDIEAELDRENQKRLLQTLGEFGCQCFLTSTDVSIPGMVGEYEMKVFHVEQGKISLGNG